MAKNPQLAIQTILDRAKLACADEGHPQGTFVLLAERIERSPAAISQWDQIPAKLVFKFVELTGYTATQIRSDLYPRHMTRAS